MRNTTKLFSDFVHCILTLVNISKFLVLFLVLVLPLPHSFFDFFVYASITYNLRETTSREGRETIQHDTLHPPKTNWKHTSNIKSKLINSLVWC